MKISTKGRYALRTVVDIAQHSDGGYISLKEISERQGISKKYLEQIVTILNHEKLLKTVRGFQGGYALLKPAYEITVGDVLRAAEGSLAPISCLDDEQNQCPRKNECQTLYVWQGLYDVINEYVNAITIQDIVDKSLGSNDFCI